MCLHLISVFLGFYLIYAVGCESDVSCGAHDLQALMVHLQQLSSTTKNKETELNDRLVFIEKLFSKKTDGGWSQWGSWNSCSNTCGGWYRTRSRDCTNPTPTLLGRYCIGGETEVGSCKQQACPTVVFRSKDLTDLTVTVNQILVFGTTTLNEGNGYDHTTGVFTAPIAGTYSFSSQLCLYGHTVNMYYAFVVNKIDIKRGFFTGAIYTNCHNTDVVAVLKSNDRVYVRSVTSTTITLYQQANVWNTFSGVLLHT